MIFHSTQDASRYVQTFSKSTIIGITSGCFDLIHPLHVDYLNKCKRHSDILIILIDTDRLCNENKGKTPLINELDRAYMLDNLKSTDVIVLMDKLDDLTDFVTYVSTKGKVRLFKNMTVIYNSPVISVPGVELFLVPDVNRFNSTTEITNYLKT